MELNEVTLLTLNGGECVNQFNEVLKDVIDDIWDPNTDPKATRKITLTLLLKPSKDRTTIESKVDIKPTMASQRTTEGQIFIDIVNSGEIRAITRNPNQNPLFNDEAGKKESANVKGIHRQNN